MSNDLIRRYVVRSLPIVATLALASPAAYAWDFQNDDGTFTGSWDTTLTYGQAWRIESRDCRLIAIADGGCGRSPNIDDGDLNYDTDMYSRALKVLTELSLNYRGVGAFVRASALYDDAAGNTAAHAAVRRSPKDLVESYTRLLDAFVYAKFDLGEHGRGTAPRPPGGELGREHLHPERHQRHQPFRRVGAARAGLGAQGRLPAAGDGQLQPAVQRQLVRAGYLHHRLERDGAGAGRFLLQHQRFRAHRRQQGGAGLRLVLRPGRGFPPARRPVHHQLPDREPAGHREALRQRPVRLQPQVLRAGLQQRHRVRPVLPELPQPPAADLRPDRHAGRASAMPSAR